MKVGDLVKLRAIVYHETGTYKPGVIGIILKTYEPTIHDARAIAYVEFGGSCISCHWHELEVVSESR